VAADAPVRPLPPLGRGLSTPLLGGVLATLAIGVVAVLGDSSVKLTAAGVATLLGLVAGALSGNPRLFCLWGLMFAVPFDLSKRFGPILAKMGGETSFRLEFSDVFWLALLAFQAHDVWSGTRPRVRVPRLTYHWLALIGIGAVWASLGTWQMTAAHETARMVKVLLLFLVLCNELCRPGRIQQAAAALTLSMLAQSCVGLLQYATSAQLGLQFLGETGANTIEQLATDSVRTTRAFRAGAFLTHPNLFGAFLAALLPVTLSLGLRGRLRQRLFYLVGLAVGSAALVATLSRSGWLSFTLAAMLLLGLHVLHPGFRRRALVTAMVAALGLACLMTVFAEPIASRLFESKDSATRGRLEWIGDATRLISVRPLLGWGLNSYAFAVPPYTKYGARIARDRYTGGGSAPPGFWLPPVHNIYLLWWAETGLLGLLIFLSLLARLLSMGVGNLRARDPLLFAVGTGSLAGLVALVIDAFLSPSLRANAILRVFWVLAAMVVAVHCGRLEQEAAEKPPSTDGPA
jgi:O-antigen ligase